MKTGQEEASLNSIESIVDLDALRGWEEQRDPALQAPHGLPALAELVQLDDNDEAVWSYPIHGPDLLVGRFQSQYAPVDVVFHQLQDHQTYRLGAPHAHLSYEDGTWRFEVLTPRARTIVGEQSLTHLQAPVALSDGDRITLGVTRFRFHTHEVSPNSHRQTRADLIGDLESPTLFLKRRGGICGPRCQLREDQPLVLGRSFPPAGHLPNTEHWPHHDPYNWDLCGVYDYERRFVAFRHAIIAHHRGRWTIAPLSARQRTFVNRIAISGRVALSGGDEIGLGLVLLRFCEPGDDETIKGPPTRDVPTVVDWSEGRPPAKTKAPTREDEQ